MRINPVSYGYNTSFDAKANINLKDGSTAIAEVVHGNDRKITRISVDIFKNGVNNGSFLQTWNDGILYNVFLCSDMIKKICSTLGIFDENDSKRIGDVIYTAELSESGILKEHNPNETLYPPMSFPGGDPHDSECISFNQRPQYDL